MKYIFTLFMFCMVLQLADAQFRYINPVPGSQYHNPETNIILRNGGFIDRTTIAGEGLLNIWVNKWHSFLHPTIVG
jgi:hypothetical protein